MRNTCTEPSFPTSELGFWPSVFTPAPRSVLLPVEAGKVASGAVGRVAVNGVLGLSLTWRPGLIEEHDEWEMGEKREEHRSFTGQKAEPLGMKLTLFLSGHEKRGKPFDLPDLKNKIVEFSILD